MNPFDTSHQPEQNLLNELKRILYAAEEFAEATARDSGEKLGEARKQFSATLKDAHRYLGDAESMVRAKAKVAAATTDTYVRTNPWKSVGVGAGIGVILGLLIGRR
jgi:ElaB/YqjD/DUF883 family membrane-anchored ribosome-binding protein